MGCEIIFKPQWKKEDGINVPEMRYTAERKDGSDMEIDEVIEKILVIPSPSARIGDVHEGVLKFTKIIAKDLEDAIVTRNLELEEVFEKEEVERVFKEIYLPAELFIKKIGNLKKIKEKEDSIYEKSQEIKSMMKGYPYRVLGKMTLPSLKEVDPRKLTLGVNTYKIIPKKEITQKDFKIFFVYLANKLDPMSLSSKYDFLQIVRKNSKVEYIRMIELRVSYLMQKRRIIIAAIIAKPLEVSGNIDNVTFYSTHNSVIINSRRVDYIVENAYLVIPEGIITKETDVLEHIIEEEQPLDKMKKRIHKDDLQLSLIKKMTTLYEQTFE